MTKDRLGISDRLILATHNEGKLREFRELLAPMGITVMSAADCGLPEPEETETTFAGNAELKAVAAMSATGLPALADDSGVTVEALNGDPGVYSARWAGEPRDFGMAMGLVLDKLATADATTDEARGAAFVAVLALARPGAETLLFEGRCDGHITDAPRGGLGFGYDPIFVPQDGDGRTFGEMSSEEKHGGERPLSHRARAVALFKAALEGGGAR
ncbi:RdgB/HAM1 family non-canonical purine NTP pyrophosphatase [Acuticoccus kandeliae]|uniref:RdgB/HAM1 family non-canonical purine NTP pyrophosphatase n=1 Tax=Acuticoccus kandeliae TaxID=2073160 RepID=UPI000D3E5E02|nr:RdgB/HAM1 family non-canonical purine NTP pyrophosphatase [Acuticoccus kandeliae]